MLRSMPRTPFDTHVQRYEDWFERHPEDYAAEVAAVGELLPTGEVLEVGAGTGRFGSALGVVAGVEPSQTMARRARSRGMDIVGGVAEALPFGDGRFDGVLMVTVLCFVRDIPLALAEARRVLRPGGHLVVAFVDRASGLGQRYEAAKAASAFYRDARFVSADEVLSLLKEAGFVDPAVRQTLLPGPARHRVLEGSGSGAFVVVRGKKGGE